jgi:tetratricopeptide (TPR) repeat protein
VIEPLLQAERLMLHGMVEQAEQIYRRVAEQDPLNAIAVMGLARVALERGDDEGALVQARAALAIDPENAAAARLESRLSEVLAERARQARAEVEAASATSAQATDQPAWSSSTPAGPAPAPEARPSEQAVFTRNPSMADHRRLETGEDGSAPTPAEQAEPAETAKLEPRRRGLLARLLRRKGGD